jgi:hypothetical protein
VQLIDELVERPSEIELDLASLGLAVARRWLGLPARHGNTIVDVAALARRRHEPLRRASRGATCGACRGVDETCNGVGLLRSGGGWWVRRAWSGRACARHTVCGHTEGPVPSRVDVRDRRSVFS